MGLLDALFGGGTPPKKPNPGSSNNWKLMGPPIPKPNNFKQFKENQMAVETGLLVVSQGSAQRAILTALTAGLQDSHAHVKDAIMVHLARAALISTSEGKVLSQSQDNLLRELTVTAALSDPDMRPIFTHIERMVNADILHQDSARMDADYIIVKQIDSVIERAYPADDKSK